MAIVSMKALLETGVHFGHRAKKWNPKMKPYIFTERNGIHIIDLQQTLATLEEAYEIVRDVVSNGGKILFVGTKRQAQETIQQEADRASMPYVNQRWLGGTLTNWKTIKSRIDQLKQFEADVESGAGSYLTKKEKLTRARIIEKLRLRLGGLRHMNRPPALMFVVDVRREHTGVKEANTLNIPIIAMVDTNCDPDSIDYVIPANDDAIRAIKLVASKLADAALEGMAMRKGAGDVEDMESAMNRLPANVDLSKFEADLDEELGLSEGGEDEAYLGQATLAKLRAGELDFGEDAAEGAAAAAPTSDAAPRKTESKPKSDKKPRKTAK
ncbi:MAG: 30S ribosomal protein S2 [Anaerolineae bacterium]|nr:30S ribosomal protein S2 [Anaerolineae bacterium]